LLDCPETFSSTFQKEKSVFFKLYDSKKRIGIKIFIFFVVSVIPVSGSRKGNEHLGSATLIFIIIQDGF